MTDPKPSVLFVCIHNAGRSQTPAGQINPLAGEARREEGIDIAA